MTKEFHDYIIIGGGSAGSVVAGRLAAAGADVLVLEAGGTDRRPDVAVPAGVVSVYKNANWHYKTEPDSSRSGAADVWPAGHILGGGGSINGTIFVRGNGADFDSWAADGAKGWDYSAVLPYFKRMESWRGTESDYRGRRGPISVTEHSWDHPSNAVFLESAVQAGYPLNPDYNGATQDGVGVMQVNQDYGMRSSASRTYLRGLPGQSRPAVRLHAAAGRILFDGDTAVGVEYRKYGRLHQVFARQEIVLSAGALASPRLLMLSGVGPADELSRVGIDAHTVLPGIGGNLQDHPGVMQCWNALVPTLNTMSPLQGLGVLAQYARHRTGPLSGTVFHVQVMHRTRRELEAPDIQIAFANFAITRTLDKNGVMKVKPARQGGFLVLAALLHPRARGRVRLRSADPTARPIIEHSMLGIPEDLRDLSAGTNEARRIMAQGPISEQVNGMFEAENQCPTDEQWDDYIRRSAMCIHHPVGTCKMGDDNATVVDPELRVHGLDRLRVIDASVMPTLPSGNTNAPTMMIAEKELTSYSKRGEHVQFPASNVTYKVVRRAFSNLRNALQVKARRPHFAGRPASHHQITV